jgi:hypothetical protein
MLGKLGLQWYSIGAIAILSWSAPELLAQGERRGGFQRGGQEEAPRGRQESDRPTDEGTRGGRGEGRGEGPARGEERSSGRGSEGRGSEGRGSEGRGSEGRGSEGRGSEGRGSEGRGSEGRGSEGRGSEGRGSEGRGSEGRGSEGRGSEGRGSEGRGSEGRGSEGRGRAGRGDEGRGDEGRRGEGRPREGGERGEGTNNRRRGGNAATGTPREQVINQLVALDLNKDGRLDPNAGEGNVLSAEIMEMVGLDPGQPVHIETLRGFVNQMDLETIPLDVQAGIRTEDAASSFDFPEVSNRSPASADFTIHPLLADATPLDQRYSALILEEVRSLIVRFDENGNGVLDASEITNVPWGPPSPLESDLDQNGQLNEVELAERLNTLSGAAPSDRRSRTRGERGSSDPEADAARAEREAEREKAAAERRERERERRNSSTDRVATYVKDLITRFDKDSDGLMSLEEAAEMRNPPPKSADGDNDGKLNEAELYAYYSDGQSPKSSSSPSTSNRDEQEESDRGPLPGTILWDGELARKTDGSESEWPSDLERKDSNLDKMVSLAEFATDLDDAQREEFGRWDKNRDGYITLAEAASGGRSSSSSSRSSSSSEGTRRPVGGRRSGMRSNRGPAPSTSSPEEPRGSNTEREGQKPADEKAQPAPNGVRYNIFGN